MAGKTIGVPGRPPVPERAGRPVRAHHQPVDRALHVDLDAERDGVVLERPDHLEAGPVADMGEAGVRVTTERPLQDAPVRRAVEDGPPQLELANAIGRLQRMELGHLRVVQELAADHRVAEMDLPRVRGGDVAHRRGDAALGHHRMGLAEQRLADEPDIRAGCLGRDRGAQPCPTGTDDEDVVRADLRAGSARRGPSVIAG